MQQTWLTMNPYIRISSYLGSQKFSSVIHLLSCTLSLRDTRLIVQVECARKRRVVVAGSMWLNTVITLVNQYLNPGSVSSYRPAPPKACSQPSNQLPLQPSTSSPHFADPPPTAGESDWLNGQGAPAPPNKRGHSRSVCPIGPRPVSQPHEFPSKR